MIHGYAENFKCSNSFDPCQPAQADMGRNCCASLKVINVVLDALNLLLMAVEGHGPAWLSGKV